LYFELPITDLKLRTPAAGVFDCKPLQIIWRKFDALYNESNTVMLDDLRRNYVMNKQNGLVIRPFQKASKTRATDRELVRLKYYLCMIAKKDSLEDLNHRHWERYLKQHLSAAEAQLLKADLEDP
jgi:ubiquitin-like domain-containing CTD phosphatase 1